MWDWGPWTRLSAIGTTERRSGEDTSVELIGWSDLVDLRDYVAALRKRWYIIAVLAILGMALAVFSLVTMPLLGIAKQRIADEIGSAATKGEGRQNMLCAYLAGALLIGLAGNALVGAWWLDPMVGLLIAAVAVKEGVEAWRGEGCCVASPLDGFADDCCR